MGTGHSIVKGTPLGELLTNWSKIDGTRGLSKKRALELRQDTWPTLTTLGIASQRWPEVGSFDYDRLHFLQLELDEQFPGQMHYWYVWNNYVWQWKLPPPKGNRSQGSCLNREFVQTSPPKSPSAPINAPPPPVMLQKRGPRIRAGVARGQKCPCWYSGDLRMCVCL